MPQSDYLTQDQIQAYGNILKRKGHSDDEVTAYKNLAVKKATEGRQTESGALTENKGFWDYAKDFGSTLVSDVADIPGQTYNAVRHPIDFMTNQAAQHTALLGKSLDPNRSLSERLGYGVAASMPFLGPGAAQAGEELGSGEYGRGAAHTFEQTLLPLVMPELARRAAGASRGARSGWQNASMGGQTAKDIGAAVGGIAGPKLGLGHFGGYLIGKNVGAIANKIMETTAGAVRGAAKPGETPPPLNISKPAGEVKPPKGFTEKESIRAYNEGRLDDAGLKERLIKEHNYRPDVAEEKVKNAAADKAESAQEAEDEAQRTLDAAARAEQKAAKERKVEFRTVTRPGNVTPPGTPGQAFPQPTMRGPTQTGPLVPQDVPVAPPGLQSSADITPTPLKFRTAARPGAAPQVGFRGPSYPGARVRAQNWEVQPVGKPTTPPGTEWKEGVGTVPVGQQFPVQPPGVPKPPEPAPTPEPPRLTRKQQIMQKVNSVLDQLKDERGSISFKGPKTTEGQLKASLRQIEKGEVPKAQYKETPEAPRRTFINKMADMLQEHGLTHEHIDAADAKILDQFSELAGGPKSMTHAQIKALSAEMKNRAESPKGVP